MKIKKDRYRKAREGTYRPIRSDTKVGTIEKKYGVNLGVRSDMKIGNYLSTSLT